MSMEATPRGFQVLTRDQLLTRIERGLPFRSTDPQTLRGEPLYTLVLGSGFSAGIVPTARQIVREEIGPFFLRPGETMDPAARGAVCSEFWRAFIRDNPGLSGEGKLLLGTDGLPVDSAVAYQVLFQRQAVGGLEDPNVAHSFLRHALRGARDRLNGAHFFLGAILDAQQREMGREGGARRRPLCRTLFTTNFDPLLQTALQFFQLHYFMTDRPERALDASSLREDDAAIHLIYAHGSIFRPLQASSEQEIQELKKANAAGFGEYFRRHHVICLGYSGWDDSLVEGLACRRGSAYQLYWCGMESPEAALAGFNPRVRALFEAPDAASFHYVQLGSGGADEFMADLYRRLYPDPGYPEVIENPFPMLRRRLSTISLGTVRLFWKPASGGSGSELGAPSAAASPMADEFLKEMVRKLELTEQSWTASRDVVNPASDGEVRGAVEAGVGGADVVASAVSRQRLAMFSAIQAERWDDVIRNAEGIAAVSTESKEKGEALVMKGLALGCLGRREEALKVLDMQLEVADAPVEVVSQALWVRGSVRTEAGRSAEAIEDYDRLLQLSEVPNPMRARALVNRGFLLEQAGEHQRSLDDLAAALGLPELPEEVRLQALVNRSLSLGATGRRPEAVRDCTAVIDDVNATSGLRARALINRALFLAELGEVRRALEDADRVIGMPGVEAAILGQALVNRSGFHVRNGDPAKADADAARALSIEGISSRTRVMAKLNRVASQSMRDESAELAVAGAEALLPEVEGNPEMLARVLFSLGEARRRLGKLEQACEDLSRVITMPGTAPETVMGARLQRAKVYQALGNRDGMEQDLTAVLGSPEAPLELTVEAHWNRGVSRMEREAWSEALEDFDALEKNPLAPSAIRANAGLNAAFVHQQRKDPVARMGALERVLKLESIPGDLRAQAYLGLAALHEQEGRTEDARERLNDALAVPGLSARFKAVLLWIRGGHLYADGAGDPVAFESELRRAAELDPANAAVRMRLGVALLFAGKDGEARDAFQSAVRMNPSESELEEVRAELNTAQNTWLSKERAEAALAILRGKSEADALAAARVDPGA